jgi:hypothetical protein
MLISYSVIREYIVTRSIYLQSEVEKARLKCESFTAKSALKISPIKMEMLSEYPFILQFHEVISETTIQTILSSSAEVHRSGVIFSSSSSQGEYSVSPVRTSVDSRVDDPMTGLTELIEDLTGLVAIPDTASETFVATQYAYGGHFFCHMDAVS